MKKIGSSLVLVVVIMASVVVVVFGASRLTLVQYNQSNRDEDNIYALYAAKAAVEDGLARFRYNHDAETTDAKTSTIPTIQRFDLTTGTNYTDQVPATDPITKVANYTPTDQYYDLKMDFRGSQIGDFNATPGQTKTLNKDDAVELTGFPTDWTNPYYLRYQFTFRNCVVPVSDRLVQIQQINQSAKQTTQPSFNQLTVKYPTDGTLIVDSADDSNNLYINSQPGPNQTAPISIRLRVFGCDINYALATTTGTGRGSNAGPMFDNLQTTITATGYYGQARRTLVATIDRSSGKLINVYDFNIYSGLGNIKP